MTDRVSITADQPLPPILRLKPQLRQQIYIHLGLDGHKFVELFGYGRPRVLHLNSYERNVSQDALGFYGLLLSCRTLYNEASALLYSRNQFVIRYDAEGSLQPLRALTNQSLSHLTSLKVILNESSCHATTQNSGHGHCCFELDGATPTGVETISGTCHWHNSPGDSHDQAIDGLSASTNNMLDEWKLTAEHLSSHITPTRLELSMVCDVLSRQDAAAAHLAVAPILLLAPLKDCHIRLSSFPILHIQHIAQDAVLQARGLSEMESKPAQVMSTGGQQSNLPPSRLLSLPQELRFRILEYTDLITPWKEVLWSRQHRGYVVSYMSCANLAGRGMECPSAIHHGCQFRKCFETYPHTSIGCFCRVRHSAFSSKCKCWAPPTNLFLICRTLCEDAQVVFFSSNTFVIHDIKANPPWYTELVEYPHERFGASQFLKEVVPTRCLRQLRFLELVFPPFCHDGWPQENHPALQDWADTVEWLRPRINAAALTIRLVMADASEWCPPEDRENMTKAGGDAILAAYARILGPLARLGEDRLSRFYAQFAWPWSWTPRAQDRLVHNPEEGLAWLRFKEKVLNERAERLVMGERYERLQKSHDQPPMSVWEYRFGRDA